MPRGVREGALGRDLGKLFARKAEEGPAGAGEPQATHVLAPLPHQALEDGTVLGVDGQQLTGAGQGHEKVAAADDGLLVGVGKGLAGLESGVARVDAHEADKSVHHHVDVGKLRELGHGLLAEAYLAGGRKLAHDGVRGA